MAALLALPAAALLEILGCFAAWAVLRQGASAWWLLPGVLCLMAFAALVALTPTLTAGRAFAVYGAVYVVAALAWAVAVEGDRLRLLDAAGTLMLLAGAGLLLVR